MSFAWPLALLSLWLVPLAVALYVLAQYRRPKYAARFTNLDLLANVVEKTPGWRRHIPAVLGLLALPSYGGNADKLGWKLVGFVDQHAWQPPFGHYDAEYAGFVPYAKATEQQS